MYYTKFTNVEAENFKGNFDGAVKGGIKGAITKSIAADYTLTAAEKNAPVVMIESTAASKSVVLGLEAGQVMFVANVGGTNAFTAKAITGDTGTSVGTGKVAIVIGSSTANASKIYVLN